MRGWHHQQRGTLREVHWGPENSRNLHSPEYLGFSIQFEGELVFTWRKIEVETAVRSGYGLRRNMVRIRHKSNNGDGRLKGTLGIFEESASIRITEDDVLIACDTPAGLSSPCSSP